jgi:hypothetical protein
LEVVYPRPTEIIVSSARDSSTRFVGVVMVEGALIERRRDTVVVAVRTVHDTTDQAISVAKDAVLRVIPGEGATVRMPLAGQQVTELGMLAFLLAVVAAYVYIRGSGSGYGS